MPPIGLELLACIWLRLQHDRWARDEIGERYLTESLHNIRPDAPHALKCISMYIQMALQFWSILIVQSACMFMLMHAPAGNSKP